MNPQITYCSDERFPFELSSLMSVVRPDEKLRRLPDGPPLTISQLLDSCSNAELRLIVDTWDGDGYWFPYITAKYFVCDRFWLLLLNRHGRLLPRAPRLTYAMCLVAVRNCPEVTRSVPVEFQNEQMWIDAIKAHPHMLQYVPVQTDEMCLLAVQRNGLWLGAVHNRTDEIEMAAVQQNGTALRFVRQQTPELCLAAVSNNEWALRLVEKQTKEIALAAVQKNPQAILWVDSGLLD
jgi:hypothetical protein